MKFVAMAVTPLIGIVILGVGFIFSVVFVGIPYPDATPAVQAQYEAKMAIADTILLSGGVVFVIGLILIPVIALMTRAGRTQG